MRPTRYPHSNLVAKAIKMRLETMSPQGLAEKAKCSVNCIHKWAYDRTGKSPKGNMLVPPDTMSPVFFVPLAVELKEELDKVGWVDPFPEQTKSIIAGEVVVGFGPKRKLKDALASIDRLASELRGAELALKIRTDDLAKSRDEVSRLSTENESLRTVSPKKEGVPIVCGRCGEALPPVYVGSGVAFGPCLKCVAVSGTRRVDAIRKELDEAMDRVQELEKAVSLASSTLNSVSRTESEEAKDGDQEVQGHGKAA
jgi:hypothetical protein